MTRHATDEEENGRAEHPADRCSIAILNDCIPMFEALKDPTRQQIVVHLLQHGPQTVGEIAQTSPLSRTAVSHHVKLLERAGLLEITKVSTRRICRFAATRPWGCSEDSSVRWNPTSRRSGASRLRSHRPDGA